MVKNVQLIGAYDPNRFAEMIKEKLNATQYSKTIEYSTTVIEGELHYTALIITKEKDWHEEI